VTPSVTTPGDTILSDATAQSSISTDKRKRLGSFCYKAHYLGFEYCSVLALHFGGQ